MERLWHILYAAILLVAVLSACCYSPIEPTEELTELSVNIYIPDAIATKAETGAVAPLDNEKVFSSLQIWVFISSGENDGRLVGYKGLSAPQLEQTGLTYSAITRFGIPLSREMFLLLSEEDARVDVYAVANAASATAAPLGEATTRSELDAVVLSGSSFGTNPLVSEVPATGLPMSGLLKSAPVTGDYPVLNVSTLTLTRSVCKLRFVFCQQGVPAEGQNPAIPTNPDCVIKSISFGGTADGHDCQISAAEKLFTDHTYGATENPFEIDGYTPLDADLGYGQEPLLANGDISISENPAELMYRSAGHEGESAREYEDRLDAAVGTSSQVGPIYIRETDKIISGTICYNAGGEDQTVTFSMPSSNVLTRNHSWILFAYFAETTRSLQLKIVVLGWERNDYRIDYTSGSVNVVRRFTIAEKDPPTFEKIQTVDGYFDVFFWHTLDEQPNVLKGDIIIATPVGQKLHIIPIPGALEGCTPISDAFTVSPMVQIIYPNYLNPENGRTEDCRLEFEISCNPGTHTDEELEGNYIDLHFCVEIGDGLRWIDLDSESIDYYRIILRKNWND